MKPALLITALFLAAAAAPATASACSFAPNVQFQPTETAARNVMPFGLLPGSKPAEEEVTLVHAASGEFVDFNLRFRGNLAVLVPDQLLEPGEEYMVLVESAFGTEEFAFTVSDEIDETPPEQLRFSGSWHSYRDGDSEGGSCSTGRFSGVGFSVHELEEPGFIEVQSALSASSVDNAPTVFNQQNLEPAGFERGDTVYLRARWHDAAGNPGEWSEIERIDTPTDCACATPGGPARSPLAASLGALGLLGVLLVRSRGTGA